MRAYANAMAQDTVRTYKMKTGRGIDLTHVLNGT